MHMIERDSLVSTHDGRFGRVESIAVIYEDGQPPVTAVRVYLLLEGKSEPFLPSDIKLRSNNDHEIIAHMRMEPEPIPASAVF